MAALYFALCQSQKYFLVDLVFENAGSRTKTVLVTLIAYNTRNFSKILINVTVYELI